jgi:hypothetical protein
MVLLENSFRFISLAKDGIGIAALDPSYDSLRND